MLDFFRVRILGERRCIGLCGIRFWRTGVAEALMLVAFLRLIGLCFFNGCEDSFMVRVCCGLGR